MERLRIVLFIAAMVATAHTSTGQQLPPGSRGDASASPAPQRYVVIGDVRNFNYFPLSERMTVRQAVLTAGILSDSVNVSVIRSNQDRSLWTQVISPTTSDSGELVLDGDILVVQSLFPITETVQKNAALRTGAGVIVVALTDEAIVVGDVLLQTDNQPSPGQQLKISSRFQGRTTVANASLSDLVAHGDVVTVSDGNRTGVRGFGSLAPVCSEWQDPETALRIPVPQTGEGPDQASGMSADEQSFGFPMSLPTQFSGSSAGAPETAGSLTDPTVAIAEPGVDKSLAVQSVSHAIPLAEPDATVVAPKPPVEQSAAVAPVTAPESFWARIPWNIVFIAGLLIAGTLILAGSLRADEAFGTAESRSMESQPKQSPGSSASEKTAVCDDAVFPIANETTLRLPQSKPSLVSDSLSNIPNSTSAVANQAAACTNVSPASLVSSGEWFDKGWLRSESEPAMVNTLTGESSTAPITQQDSQASVHSEQSSESVIGIPEPIAVVLPGQVLPAISDESGSTVRTAGFTDLEDLLQNRLPIDLCETRLPLRIVLFGRPAGPRRLRIDAAHSTLAAPHMKRSAERKREEPAVVSDTASGAEIQTTGAFNSLDRALNHLQERTDS